MPSRKTKRKNPPPGRGRAASRPQEAVPLPPFTSTLGFAASTGTISSSSAEALVLWIPEGARKLGGLPEGKLRRLLEGLVRSEGFDGKRGATLLFHPAGAFRPKRVILAGLGRPGAGGLEAIRQGAAAAAARAAAATARSITFTPPPEPFARSVEEKVRAVAEGFLLGTYRMRKYLTGEERNAAASLRRGEILVARADLAGARRAVRRTTIVCRATNLARDLVNEPALALTPSRMAEYASALAKRAGVECSVFDEGDLRRMGMGAFLGVASGSHQPPRMIHLHYRPEGTPVRKLAIVGKGLTFDSGGLSLKTATGMETMKLDKGGSAAVLATMLSLPELKPRVEVHGLMGMTENMPGGSAIKPGDVVRTCGGKTVEIINTDAEGRLVLADVLGYTRGLGADEVIDLATLTGACMVALGPLGSGLFTDDAEFADSILSAAERAGEKFWRLPMYEEYRDQLRSEIADIKNTGERYGGATTAALFLREFIGRDRRWAHLDIAGPAFLEQDRHAYMRRGATGAGVRTLLAYIADLSGRD